METVDKVLIETQIIALFNYREQLGKEYNKLKMSDRKIELRDQIITVNSVCDIMFNEHRELLANWKNLYRSKFEQ
jgi:hypothetical protein